MQEAENDEAFYEQFVRSQRLLHTMANRLLSGPPFVEEAVQNCLSRPLAIRRSLSEQEPVLDCITKSEQEKYHD